MLKTHIIVKCVQWFKHILKLIVNATEPEFMYLTTIIDLYSNSRCDRTKI